MNNTELKSDMFPRNKVNISWPVLDYTADFCIYNWTQHYVKPTSPNQNVYSHDYLKPLKCDQWVLWQNTHFIEAQLEFAQLLSTMVLSEQPCTWIDADQLKMPTVCRLFFLWNMANGSPRAFVKHPLHSQRKNVILDLIS